MNDSDSANPTDDAVMPRLGWHPPSIPRMHSSNSHVRQRCKFCAKHKTHRLADIKILRLNCFENCDVHLCSFDYFALWHSVAAILIKFC